MIACARSATCSVLKISVMELRTVLGLSTNRSAIALGDVALRFSSQL
jgi:hypothetical protein